jgi:hypothetical protein
MSSNRHVLIAETTPQFAMDTGVRIAINANFFAPCCNAFAEPKTAVGLRCKGTRTTTTVCLRNR